LDQEEEPPLVVKPKKESLWNISDKKQIGNEMLHFPIH
jgi:hypothetical protein